MPTAVPLASWRRRARAAAQRLPVAGTCMLLMLAVCALDLWWPLGVAVAALYSLVVVVTLLSPDPALTRNTALMCTALIVAGALFSPESKVPHWIVILNAAIFTAVVWATALLVVYRQRAARQIHQQHEQLERANLELARQAQHDGLTGIANRRAFDAHLVAEAARANRAHAPLSLLMIDVDYFKRYNDAAGHPAGDACLKAIAMAIQGTLRRPDDLAARYGGEEFAVLLPETTLAGAHDRADEICRTVRALRIVHPGLGDAAHLTVSIGVHCEEPPVSASVLVEQADRRLYQAKLAGRDCAFGEC